MLNKDNSNVTCDFFLDSAKITFGSLVINLFAPGIAAKMPWVTLLTGLSFTTLFLVIARKLSKTV